MRWVGVNKSFARCCSEQAVDPRTVAQRPVHQTTIQYLPFMKPRLGAFIVVAKSTYQAITSCAASSVVSMAILSSAGTPASNVRTLPSSMGVVAGLLVNGQRSGSCVDHQYALLSPPSGVAHTASTCKWAAAPGETPGGCTPACVGSGECRPHRRLE